jgi:sugar/nucleoside kinase (ribokinase family)
MSPRGEVASVADVAMSTTTVGGSVTVAVLGPVYCDLVFGGLERLPRLGEESFARRFLATAGGSAISAIALRRLGHRVALLSEVGDDAHGVLVRARIAEVGVDDRWLGVRSDVPTPVTVAMSTEADRAFVTYLDPGGPTDGPPGAFRPDLPEVLLATRAAHLHVAGFPVALAHPDVVDVAHQLGLTVSFDPGWDEGALADARVRRVAMAVDVLLINLLEARLLSGGFDVGGGLGGAGWGQEAPAAGAAGDLPALLAHLAGRRPRGVTVIKDGAAGAWGADDDGLLHVDAPVVATVDATGAGDVFTAGFLDAWWAAEPLAACLRRGTICGARATTSYGGATAAPTRAELDGWP